MRDLWFQTYFSLNCNHIDLPVIDCMFCRVMFGAGEHMSAFSQIDILFGKKFLFEVRVLTSTKIVDIILLGDDIYFTIRSPRVASDDLIAALHRYAATVSSPHLPTV